MPRVLALERNVLALANSVWDLTISVLGLATSISSSSSATDRPRSILSTFQESLGRTFI